MIGGVFPALIGAIGVMAYNYLRFHNPFEFGFNYQLTISNPAANTITLDLLPATIYHYYLQAPDIHAYFPYFFTEIKSIRNYPRFVYLCNNIGAFFYPVTLGILGMPVLFKRKENGFREFFFGSLFICAAVLSFIDMCKAGVHYRYVADILLPLLLVGVAVLFEVMRKIRNLGSEKLLFVWRCMVTFLMLFTVLLGAMMIFANQNKYIVLPPM